MKFLLELIEKFKRFFFGVGKKAFKIIAVISLVIALCMSVYDYFETTRVEKATVTLNYEEAKQGLNPDGSKFNIADIKSDEVLQNALAILGDDSLSVDSVKGRITIDAKMPISAIEQTRAAIASGSTYNYNPSEFDVYYSQNKKLSKNNTVDFLDALSQAYYEYFISTYSDKNIILEFDGADDFDDYDYYEIFIVLENKINSMISYLGSHQEENTTFRSSKTGYSFENLITMLLNLRDKDLEKYRAYVVQYKISKDHSDFIGKQKYLIEKESTDYKSNMEASNIINASLVMYDPNITGVAFIPSIDDQDEYYMGRTKTGIDDLAIDSYKYGEKANSLKKDIDERQYLISKFSTDEKHSAAVKKEADSMIVDICVFLEKISTISVLTDDDYISYKTNDYITFDLPEKYLYVPFFTLVFGFVVSIVVITVAYSVLRMCKETIVKIKNNVREEREKEDKTEEKIEEKGGEQAV